jgi:magnesium chelatase family protein
VLAHVTTFALEGIAARRVTVEVDIRNGLPAFAMVGLPDAAVRESRDRVRAALLNAGFDFPMQRLTVNLAPGGLRKAGPAFDLAVAVGILAASSQLPEEACAGLAVCGELSLGGALRPVRGALAVALAARDAGCPTLAVPTENAPEAAVVDGIEIAAVPGIRELVELLHGRWRPPPVAPIRAPANRHHPDLADVVGQDDARRALEIAAAGGHNLLMIGAYGAGKTMLARRLPGILPPPTFDESVEVMRIHGVAGTGDGRLRSERPFRAPHHSISRSGLVGGGAVPRPGEITLAHRGVLFLDELAEFSRPALEALREPLEEGRIVITRGQRTLELPAEFMLVAASNACPCGRTGEACACTEADRARYARRLSGPLLDRIDLICNLAPPAPELLMATESAPESSATVRERVLAARACQEERLGPGGCNARMGEADLRRHVRIDRAARDLLVRAAGAATLSARAHRKVLRLARTIADLEGHDRPAAEDVEEALSYRLAGRPGVPAGLAA